MGTQREIADTAGVEQAEPARIEPTSPATGAALDEVLKSNWTLEYKPRLSQTDSLDPHELFKPDGLDQETLDRILNDSRFGTLGPPELDPQKQVYGPPAPGQERRFAMGPDQDRFKFDLDFKDHDALPERLKDWQNIDLFEVPAGGRRARISIGRCDSGVKGLCINIPSQ
ncbi:MAG: hypothetical protein AB7W16_00375 [Candidatus Obscuribacterales bacterium]